MDKILNYFETYKNQIIFGGVALVVFLIFKKRK